MTLSTYAHLFRKDDSKAAAAINAALNLRSRRPPVAIRWQNPFCSRPRFLS